MNNITKWRWLLSPMGINDITETGLPQSLWNEQTSGLTKLADASKRLTDIRVI
jgi:hypothetical protein